ncbi:MAG: Holliday junction resolvase RuvX [Nitrospinota bacterium]
MNKRILGLDIGSKRSGAAITDDLRITVQPLKSWEKRGYKDDLKNIKEILDEYDLEVIVVGNPLNMDGSIGEQSKKYQELSKKLERDLPGLKIVLHDERLSSIEADEVMSNIKTNRKRRKELRDQIAAQIILSDWLKSDGAC